MFHLMGADGVRLAADSWGPPAGAAVVLLHGGGQTRHAWGGTGAALGAAGFHAIALDTRGHGDSDPAPDGDYRLDRLVADLRSVLTSLDREAAVVGASLGGITGLLAEGERGGAASGTEGSRSDEPPLPALVLVDSAARIEAAGADRIRAFMTAEPDGFADLEAAAAAIGAYMPHRPPPSDLSGLAKNLRQGEDGRWRWHWDPAFLTGKLTPGEIRRDAGRLEAAARHVRAPTLLVRGRMSDVVSEEGARAFLALVPHAEYVDVSGAGHMVAGDRNDVFTSAVADFLGRVLH